MKGLVGDALKVINVNMKSGTMNVIFVAISLSGFSSCELVFLSR